MIFDIKFIKCGFLPQQCADKYASFFVVSTSFQRLTTVPDLTLYSTNSQSTDDVKPELLQSNNASSSGLMHSLNMLQHSNNNNIHAASNNGMMSMMMSGSNAQDRNFRRRRRRRKHF